ncbi:hypothetical protein BST61_g2029 [Cercospora zeina]
MSNTKADGRQSTRYLRKARRARDLTVTTQKTAARCLQTDFLLHTRSGPSQHLCTECRHCRAWRCMVVPHLGLRPLNDTESARASITTLRAKHLDCLALLISTLVIYSDSYNDPHALLAFALTLLATSSHVAPLVETNKSKIRPLFPRCILFLGEHLAFTIHFLRRPAEEQYCPFGTVRLVVLVCGAVLWICIAANMVICLWRPKDNIPGIYAQLIKCGAYASIIVGSIITVAMTATALYLVYGQKVCDMLEEQEDSMWSFGQYLAILMLLVPILSFTEHLIGDRDTDGEDTG